MNRHKKQIIVTVLISVLVILYFIFYFALLISVVQSVVMKIVFAIVPLLIGAAMIGVCLQRIREIEGGEEDDLSQY